MHASDEMKKRKPKNHRELIELRSVTRDSANHKKKINVWLDQEKKRNRGTKNVCEKTKLDMKNVKIYI